jgi:phosphatidate cytidylyltransferase|tara:strand:- start:512 stop:1171 length:660 start_codon:yes stop_codon:yes gene_type:complete
MNKELQKRLITSIFLLSLLILMSLYTFVLIISLVVIAIIAWIEFYSLIHKIFINNNFMNKIFRFFFKAISLFYMSLLVYLIMIPKINDKFFEIIIIYSILISIMSDVGGMVIGRIFKGKKLTKISPNKTISGSIGSFIFSLFLIPLFIKHLDNYDLVVIILFTLLISLTSQIGDLLISLLKRKAKVKDTSDLLPGHGGILDRIDGIIFALPLGILIFSI